MRKVKITVLRTMFNEDLAAEYGAEGLKAIYQYVFALAHGDGTEIFYYGDWIRKPGTAICSCNDGLRPVIFKLEATNEEAQIDYEPVR
ncbi:MAG TPA: TIGR04076 family protein [Candidatus Acetatifactor stercoripullorum]|uniref:TIGR04076 family protein n=1 Tax=Candidatus Acetatifactor stercoripullorum TaxID=2838414 RepID=A0A9D1R6F0_9FIRM|nr:TIGR04076 family protein [uncultured Acetatifactor sp.]HIW81725.1 TIGR04076 family protein [Candidatus Acetatifactor stercoripullorum]